MTLESAVQQYEQTNSKLVDEVVDLKSSYRATAAAANNMHAAVAEGLAGTPNGGYFSVPGDGVYLTLYRNAAGTASVIATYPKADDVEQAGLDAASVAADRTAVEAAASQVAGDASAASSARAAAESARDDAVNIAGGDAQPIFDVWVVDAERRAFEAATGGACTIERTAGGQACHMFVLPRMRWEDLIPSGELGSGTHEAFIVDGVEKSELLVGMYQAATRSGELVSQPRLVPRKNINWDDSRAEAQAAGMGITSTWDWSAIAFWCMANGFQPRGNTDERRSHSHPHENGVHAYSSYGRVQTLTGSGPASWRHNNAAAGIADLVGNLWEWVWGCKTVDGRVFLASDNDKNLVESEWADTGFDMPSASSTSWAGLYDGNAEAPIAVRRALIMPNGVADPDGSLWTNLAGERFPLRGGYSSDADAAGLGALALYSGRTNSNITRGLRLTR